MLLVQCLPLNSSAWCFLSLHQVKDVHCLSAIETTRFLLTELGIHALNSSPLQCANPPYLTCDHCLTHRCWVAPVRVPSCQSIWTDHVCFPVEGTRNLLQKVIRVCSLNCLYQDVLLRDIHSLYNFDCKIFCKYTFLLFKQLSKLMCNDFYTMIFTLLVLSPLGFAWLKGRFVTLIKLCK